MNKQTKLTEEQNFEKPIEGENNLCNILHGVT